MKPSLEKLFGEGVRRSNGDQARRYNLLAARLIADLVKNLLGPRGLEKMFIDILGEVTVTKDGATLLHKIDVEHPAAKLVIEASNAVDNEVGDGTTSVVVLVGALVEKAEELLDMGIAPPIIADGYFEGLEFALEVLQTIAKTFKNDDIEIMEKIAQTSLRSKSIYFATNEGKLLAKLLVRAICTIADFNNNKVEADDIKIEEKFGNTSDIQLVKGVVIDKTIDNSAMPRIIKKAKILLLNEGLEGKRTKTDAEIQITSHNQIQSYIQKESEAIISKIKQIVNSGANVVVSQKGVNMLAQDYLAKEGIISIRRVKENDMQWIAKATGAKITRDLNSIADTDLGYAEKVYEKFVADDKMVFVDGCKNPKSVTLLLRANSKRSLDEYHRSVLDVIAVLRNFIIKPSIVAGAGSTEAIIANKIRLKANSIDNRRQIVVRRLADALEEIPLTIARNAGMNTINTLTKLRNEYYSSMDDSSSEMAWYGIDAIERKVENVFHKGIIEPSVVREQILKTAVEVTNMLICVDDVLMARPALYAHTHADGMRHSHVDGDKKHDHYFDTLGKKQRPIHHYY